MKSFIVPLAFIAALAAAPSLAAQQAVQNFAVEVRGGMGVGAYEHSGAGLEFLPEPSFGVTGSYAFSRSVALYAGYHRTSFGCEARFCEGADVEFTSSGFGAGVRYTAPVRWSPWLRAGMVMDQLTVSDDTSDPAFGFEAGAGLGFPVTPRIALTPGISYMQYSASFEGEDETGGVASFTGDLGIRFSF